MGSEVLQTVGVACIALSASILVVLLVRTALRKAFGASAAYLAWATVPLAAITPLLPHATMQAWPHAVALPVQAVNAAMQTASHPYGASASIAVAIWGLGALFVLLAFIVQHRGFLDSLGPLAIRHGVARPRSAAASKFGPLLLGLWRPVVVLPLDFRQRYTARERLLILAHERSHLRRRDPIANVMCAALQCIFWFNPLAHFAAHTFRFDQELGCDDLVMRRHPGLRRTYADAILKTQVASGRTPLACQWQFTHPLKVRIMQLNNTTARSARRLLGRILIAATVAACTYGAWAAQSGVPNSVIASAGPSGQVYDILMAIQVEGQTFNPRVRTTAGSPAIIQFGADPMVWNFSLSVEPKDGKNVLVRSNIQHGQQDVAKPVVMLSLGQTAGIHLGADEKHPDIDIKLTLTERPVGK